MGEADDSSGRTLAGWFEHWVDEQPEALALAGDDGVRLTYAELEEQTNRIANAIEALDPQRAFPVVAIAIDQSSDAVRAIVGASKTGRCIVPLDVAAPTGRIVETLAQVDPAVVLTRDGDSSSLDALPAGRCRALYIDRIDTDGDARRKVRPVDVDGIEVVQFTSGSTGRPKGVPRPTRAAIGALRRRQDEGHLGPGRRVAATSDFQWAAGWSTIRDTLSTGGSLHRYSTRRRGPSELAMWLRAEQVATWATIPSLLRATVASAPPGLVWPDLTAVRMSGEVLHRSLVEEVWPMLPDGATIGNRYGSSETGGVCGLTITRATVFDSEVVPVGPPLAGVQVTISEPDADGVGDVVVTGFRGALSYLGGDPEGRITAHADGLTTYRTGDQGRMRSDGMLELRGRSDRMVKVRGHRVDLNEVEIALREMPAVIEATTGLHHDERGGRISAWVVTEGSSTLTVSDLRRHLRKRLPGYMVPSAFVFMDVLPRTSRGKLDRSRLPDPLPDRPDLSVAFSTPRGRVEEVIATAFGRVLDIGPIGRHDPFFDLGGDSLQAAEVMTMISAALGRDLPLSVFVQAETPAQLAVELGSTEPEAADHLVVLQPAGDQPPIYCVHGGGGQVLSFAALATRLGTARPFVGIQMRARDRARRLFSVRRLGRTYAAEVRERQHGAPCIVAGHSYGAVVAFEVVRRLRQSSAAVDACVLLDCGVPDRRLLWSRMSLGRAVSGNETAVRRGKEVAYATHALLGLRPRPHRLTTERMQAALWGMSLYRPEPVDVPIVVVRARGGAPGRDLAGWGAFTTAGCSVIEVPGDHHSILTPPHLHRLAEALDEALSARRSSAG